LHDALDYGAVGWAVRRIRGKLASRAPATWEPRRGFGGHPGGLLWSCCNTSSAGRNRGPADDADPDAAFAGLTGCWSREHWRGSKAYAELLRALGGARINLVSRNTLGEFCGDAIFSMRRSWCPLSEQERPQQSLVDPWQRRGFTGWYWRFSGFCRGFEGGRNWSRRCPQMRLSARGRNESGNAPVRSAISRIGTWKAPGRTSLPRDAAGAARQNFSQQSGLSGRNGVWACSPKGSTRGRMRKNDRGRVANERMRAGQAIPAAPTRPEGVILKLEPIAVKPKGEG